MAGAWMVILLIPLLVMFFKRVNRHYENTAKKLAGFRVKAHTLFIEHPKHVAVVPISGIHQGIQDALIYATSISKTVKACYVDVDPDATQKMISTWKETFPEIDLIILPSPYRSVLRPVVVYVEGIQKSIEHDMITVIIPEFVTGKWYHKFLHNQTAIILFAYLRPLKNVMVTSVRYHI